MEITLRASTPAAPPPDASEALPMPTHARHALPDPTPVASIASVLTFGPDGVAEGVLSQADVDWIADQLDTLGVVFAPKPWPGARSPYCGYRWEGEYGGEFICTLPKGPAAHASGWHIAELDGEDNAVISTDAEVTV